MKTQKQKTQKVTIKRYTKLGEEDYPYSDDKGISANGKFELELEQFDTPRMSQIDKRFGIRDKGNELVRAEPEQITINKGMFEEKTDFVDINSYSSKRVDLDKVSFLGFFKKNEKVLVFIEVSK